MLERFARFVPAPLRARTVNADDEPLPPRAKGESVPAGKAVAHARIENLGLDRGTVVGEGLRWTAGWSLRFIIIGIALYFTLYLVGTFWAAFLPILMALVIASVLWPPTRWMRTHGLPAALASLISILGLFAIGGGAVAVMTPMITEQVPELTQKTVQGISKIQEWAQGPPLNIQQDQVDSLVKTATDTLQSSSDKIASGVFLGVTVAGEVLVNVVIALVLTFFMLKDGPKFLPWLRAGAGRGAGAHLTEMLTRVWRTLAGFIRTQAVVSAIDAIFIGLGLVFLGVPLAMPLAMLTFFGGFIPIVGAFVAGTLAVLVALVTQGLGTAIAVLVLVVAVQQIEGNLLQPFLQSKSMDLHPALVLLSVTLGAKMFGIIGAFFAVPAAASLAVAIRYVNEQIDLRTGDLEPDDTEPLTSEGKYANAESAKWARQHADHDGDDLRVKSDKDVADAVADS